MGLLPREMINLLMKLKQTVASCGSRMQNIGFFWVRAIEEPTFHQKMWGLWVPEQRQSAKIWGHWVTAALKIGGLWSHIRVTSIMGVPPGEKHIGLLRVSKLYGALYIIAFTIFAIKPPILMILVLEDGYESPLSISFPLIPKKYQ